MEAFDWLKQVGTVPSCSKSEKSIYSYEALIQITSTLFVLIEARCASAGISPSETCLFPEKTIIVIETPLASYILQVCIAI